MGTVEFAVGYHDLFFDLMCKMLDIPRCLMFDEQGLFGTTCLFLGHFADVVRGRGDESHWGFGGIRAPYLQNDLADGTPRADVFEQLAWNLSI